MRKKDMELLRNVSIKDRRIMQMVCETVNNPMEALECYQRKYPFLFKTAGERKYFINARIGDYFMKTG